MPIYYLDTSAIMKRYRTEIGSDVVDEIFDGLTDSDELATSYLTLLEVNSAATRLLKGRVIAQSVYRRILSRFTLDIFNDAVTLLPIQNELIDSAIDIAGEYALRSLDALHFASALIAIRMSSDSQGLFMVSADRELLEACESYGILTLNPQSNDAIEILRSLRGRVG